MSMLLGHKVSQGKAEKWAGALGPWLLPGEEILALFDCNNLRPSTDAIAVTNFRIGGVTSTGWSVDFPYANRIRVEPDLAKETVFVGADDPSTLRYDATTRRPEMLFKMVKREDHRLLMATVSAAVARFDEKVYRAATAQMVLYPTVESSQGDQTTQVAPAEPVFGAAARASQVEQHTPVQPTRPDRPKTGSTGALGPPQSGAAGHPNAAAGWYPVPGDKLRYWDGTQWTRHETPSTMPAAPAPEPDLAPSSPPPERDASPEVTVASWLGWGGLVLAALLGAVSSGMSGFFAFSGIYLLVVAVIALIRGRVGWAHLRTRAAGATALGAAVVLTIVGGATASPPTEEPTAAPPASSAPAPTTASPTRSATPTATATPTPSATRTATLTPATAAKGTALAAVAKLAVKGRAPKTGYDPDKFGQAWFDTDRNGCDTRNDMLRRDLVDRDMKNWCKVLAGTADPDPYTGRVIRFVIGGPSEIDIDHVVALSDAWQKGAAKWSAGKRLAFANDPLSLLAVDASANRAKGDGDVATWLPPNKPYRCEYVARVVSIKIKYKIWVTSAERDAMVRVLSNCATTALPKPGPAPTTAAVPKSTAKPAPEPAAPPAPEPDAPTSVYYPNCDAVRAAGAAPLHRGEPGYSSKLDRDGDGVACEP